MDYVTTTEEPLTESPSVDDVAERLDNIVIALNGLGEQMNWLVENLQSMFVFIQQIGSNGGGIRGLMQAMKQGPPELQQVMQPPEGEAS